MYVTPKMIAEHDSADMLGFIDDLPNQFTQAWQGAQSTAVPAGFADDIRQIVIVGMGGSAISGDLLAGLFADSCPAPITVVRGYDLPACFTGSDTLLIALSHSGGTEETLSAATQARDRGAKLLAVTTGGELGPMVSEAGGPVFSYEYDSPPRAAIGMLYGTLLGAVNQLGLVDDLTNDFEEGLDLLHKGKDTLDLNSPPETNPAKRTAAQLVGRIPIFWGAGLLWPVALRWKTQINENSKSASYAEQMPELNHNSVVGLDYPDPLMNKIAVVQLQSKQHNHPRVRIRQDVSNQILLQSGVMADQIRARGKSRLAQQMTMIQFGDYLSYYLAMFNGADPTPIDNINFLKQRLAEA